MSFRLASDSLDRALARELKSNPRPDPLWEALKICVIQLTRNKRDAGEPPERIIVALKEAASDAGLAPRLDPARPLVPGFSGDVVDTMVVWCIETYYESFDAKQAAS